MAMGTVHNKQNVHGGSQSKLQKFGAAVGTLGGAVVGAYMGNPTAGAAYGGTVGGKVGGAIGHVVDPSKVSNPKSLSPLQTTRAKMPEVQMAALENAKARLSESGDLSAPEAKNIYTHLTSAQQELRNRLK